MINHSRPFEIGKPEMSDTKMVESKSQSLRSDLEDWSRFTRGESHILKEHPGLIWQQGANQPKNSAVSRQAALLEDSGRWIGRPWLRWINRPEERSPCRLTLKGHAGSVNAVAVIPGSTRVVSGSYDRTLKIWDIESGEEPQTLTGHRDIIHAVAVTPDGRTIVSGSNDKTVRVWSVESGRMLRTFKGHESDVNAVAVFPDGRRFVSASYDGALKIWEIGSANPPRSLQGHSDVIKAVAITPDGRRIISGDQDGTLAVWDSETGIRIHALSFGSGHVVDTEGRVHSFSVLAVAVDPNSRFVTLEVGGRGALKVLDLESLEELRNWVAQPEGVPSLAVTLDGTRIVSGGYDSTLKIWDAQNGKELQTLRGHGRAVRAVVVTPDGRRAVSASDDDTIKVWDIEGSKSLRTPERTGDDAVNKWHELGVNALATIGADRIVSAGASTMRIWDIKSARSSPTSRLSIPTRELAEGLHVTERTFLPHVVECVALTADGRKAITGGADHAVIIWDIVSGKKLHTLRGHKDKVNAVAVSPDGTRIVSAGDYTLRIWNADSGRQIEVLEGHFDIIQTVAITPDGRRIVSGGWDGLRLWDVEKGVELPTPRWPLYDELRGSLSRASTSKIPPILVLAVTPTGQVVVSGNEDGKIRFWDSSSGEELRSFRGHNGPVSALAVTPDGLRLVSGGWDKSLKVWDAESLEPVAQFFLPSDVASITTRDNLIFAGDTGGDVYMLELCCVQARSPIVTSHMNGGQYSFRCSHCLKITPSTPADLGHEIVCPHCRGQMRLNAFTVVEQTRPWWRFWRR